AAQLEGQPTREARLHQWGAGDRGDAHVLGRLEERLPPRRPDGPRRRRRGLVVRRARLLRLGQRGLGHDDVVGRLHDAEPVRLAADFAGQCGERAEREVLPRVGRDAVAIPGRGAVDADPALVAQRLEQLERRAHARQELGAIDGAELRLRVVQVVHVDALHAEVRAAALDLRAQEGRREAVIASDQLLRPAQARLDEALAYVLRVRTRRAGRCAVERDVAALGADDDLVAHGDPLLDGEAERAAERALAALAAVVDRGVQQVHAAGQARERRGLVALVVLRVALAQV